jgi:methionyl-tRNA synthetase
MKAKKEGITPQEVIDKYDGIIRKSFSDFEFHLIITENFG